MVGSHKNQALRQKIMELEKQATGERQDAATCFKKSRHQNEVKTLKHQQLQDQELQVLSVSNSYLQHQYKSLLQRHTLLLGAFKDVKTVTFEEYISAEDDKVAQDQIEAIREETKNMMEALQSKIKEWLTESAFAKDNNASLSNSISTKREEIEKLKARVNTLTMETEKLSAKIQGLEIPKDASDRALCESIQSQSTGSKMLQEAQSQYNTEKTRLESELDGSRKQVEMQNEKLKKEKKEKEDKLKEEEEKVRSSVQPRSNTPGGEASSAVFTPLKFEEPISKYYGRVVNCMLVLKLAINKYNVLAVGDGYHTVYLYSETNKREENYVHCNFS